MVVLDPFDKLERPGANQQDLASGDCIVTGSSMLKYSNMSNMLGRGLSDVSTTVYLSGVSTVNQSA